MGERGVSQIRGDLLENQIWQAGRIVSINENELFVVTDIFSHFRQKLEEVEQGQSAISGGNLFSWKFRCLKPELMGEFIKDVPSGAIILAIAVSVGDDQCSFLHLFSSLTKTSPMCGEVLHVAVRSTAAGS